MLEDLAVRRFDLSATDRGVSVLGHEDGVRGVERHDRVDVGPVERGLVAPKHGGGGLDLGGRIEGGVVPAGASLLACWSQPIVTLAIRKMPVSIRM